MFDIEAQLAGFSFDVSMASGSETSCWAGVARVSGFESGAAASFLSTAGGDVAVGLSVVGGELGDGEKASSFRLGFCGDFVLSCPFVNVDVVSCPFVNGLGGPWGVIFSFVFLTFLFLNCPGQLSSGVLWLVR